MNNISSANIGTTSIDSLPVGPQSQMQGPPQENIRLDIDILFESSEQIKFIL